MSDHEVNGSADAEDLPEGVIDADPAGGWESAQTADAETSDRSDAQTADAGLPSDVRDADGESTGYEAEADDAVETAEVTQGIDPDLAVDEDAQS